MIYLLIDFNEKMSGLQSNAATLYKKDNYTALIVLSVTSITNSCLLCCESKKL